ncbi:hypothetical protein KIW84_050500 [Lathyrus oleraceus]|uniref:Uncharacterized protein n=1 Tax=Pisum sativum TaxID=3888 RepID=A0A9D4WIP2_PEA|nr:hypothetical protein KIW84_050500 [Pisum sativum]
MTYTTLYPSLVLKNLLQPRNHPQIPEPLPWWYKSELRCAFHQGAPSHDIENCYPLKYEVQKLVKSGRVSFEDCAPNVKANPLPAHGNSSINMVDDFPGEFKVFDVCFIRSSSSNNISNKSVSPLVIRLAGLVPYTSDKVVPYQYNATMLENGQEVPLPTNSSIVGIVDVTKVTRNGHVFGSVFPKNTEDFSVSKKVDVPVVESIDKEKRVQYGGAAAPNSLQDFRVVSANELRSTQRSTAESLRIGPSDFQITFQVMDIHPAYSCLLGRPWIHEAGVVTSTLHQKLKFVKNGKLVTVGGEKVLLVSHLSSFSYVEAEDEVGTSFQALSITEDKRVWAHLSSFKDAQKIVEDGISNQWGQMVEVTNNKSIAGLGFQRVAMIEGDEDKDCTNFVTHGKACNNWTAVDIPVIMHQSKLVSNPIEYNDPSPSPNFEFPVFEAEEESDEEVSDELSRLLEHEEKAIQPFEEQIELVNLGSEDDVKEVKIGSQVCPEVKKGLIDLLREYSDVFAWSYQDMPGLNSEIVEHRLSLKPECPTVKQKLRRTHPDMAVKIKEEVHKQIDVDFLVTVEYPQWVAKIVLVSKKDGKSPYVCRL